MIRTTRRYWWFGLLLVAAMVLGVPAAMAQGPVTGPESQPQFNFFGGRDWTEDFGRLEVAVEVHADYPGTANDLLDAVANGQGLYSYLRSRGWIGAFEWYNGNSWEEEFKKAELGGTENFWVDSADLVFYEGHGGPGSFSFHTPSGSGFHDDSYLQPPDAFRAWGDNDAEFIALLSCSVLADVNLRDWAITMNGLHLLMGFKNTAYDVGGFGLRFATYLDNPFHSFPVAASWFKACDDKQPGGTVARIIAEEPANFYFDSKDYQEPDYLDSDYWWWNHNCGGRAGAGPNFAYSSATQAAITQMPVFRTPPLDLAGEAIPLWNKLGGAFEVPTPTVMIQADGGNYLTSESGGRLLQMDMDNGLFTYIDSNQMYTPTTGVAIQAATMDITTAKNTADAFLQNNGLMPSDAAFNDVASDTLEGAAIAGRAAGVISVEAQTLGVTLTNYTVIYERLLTANVANSSGVQAPAQFSVVGPGGKLNVNVSPTAQGARVASAQQVGDGAVIGAQGGWRRISDTIAVQAVLPVISADAANALFQQLEPQVALAQVPFLGATSKQVLSSTLAYWEEPSGTGQDVLYPAYALYAQYDGIQNGQPVSVTDWTYIPANATYMRPFAKILATSDASTALSPGQVFTATAADASLTLTQLGYTGGLNFPLGTGPIYTYAWYLNAVDDAHMLTDADDSPTGLSFSIPLELLNYGKSVPAVQTLFLVVTDPASDHTSQNVSTASIPFSVTQPIYLPIVFKAF